MTVKKRQPTVPERLAALGKIHQERGKVYGDDYKHFGKVLAGLFPEGLTLKTADDFTRFGLFVQMATKMNRYSRQFHNGGHVDSLDDLAVYSQLLQDRDADG